MPEIAIHTILLAVALLGTAAGLLAQYFDGGLSGNFIWSAATLPVAAVLAASMMRDLLSGRVGVDAIALVAMLASIALGEPLAGTVVAMMYSGGNLLEGYARGKAERSTPETSFWYGPASCCRSTANSSMRGPSWTSPR
jgi:cation transport ATPase